MSGDYEYVGLVHFHSYQSRISLELPAGWEEDSEGENQVVYVRRRDNSPSIEPRLIVSVQAVPAEAEAWRELADDLRDREGREVVESREIDVDSVPARLDIVGYDEPQLGGRVIQLQAFAQISDVLFRIVGVSAWEERAMWTPDLEDAVSSIRFILV